MILGAKSVEKSIYKLLGWRGPRKMIELRKVSRWIIFAKVYIVLRKLSFPSIVITSALVVLVRSWNQFVMNLKYC
jgi:hypothetical protein